MGQAISKLNKLRARREMFLKNQERIEKLFGAQRSSYYSLIQAKQDMIILAALDRDIEALEKEAETEQEKETIEAVLKDIQNEATKAGKVLANALQQGLNGK